MNTRTIYFAFFLFLLLSMPVFLSAQVYYFANYSLQEGLPDSRINDMAFDQDEVLWLGTKSGLSAFNGHSFQNYTSADGLAPNVVKSVFIDSKNRTWTGHYQGGLSYRSEGRFHQLHFQGLDMNKDIYGISEDRNGNIWLATIGNGAICIKSVPSDTIPKNSYSVYSGQEGLSDLVLGVKAANEELFFLTDLGFLYKYKPNQDNFEILKPDGLPSNTRLIAIASDSDGLLLGSTLAQVFRYNPDNIVEEIQTGLNLRHTMVSALLRDKKSQAVWAGFWNRGLLMDTSNEKIFFDESNGLNANQIRCLLQDREGNILIGTSESGLLIFRGRQFVNYSNIPVLANHQIWSVLHNDNGYWFATNKGIINLKSLEPEAPESEVKIYEPDFFNSPAQKIRSLVQGTDGKLWAGTLEREMLRYDPHRDAFYPVRELRSFFKDIGQVTALTSDHSGNIWAGTFNGLIQYQPEKGHKQRFSQRDGIPGNNISALYIDDNECLWLGAVGKGIGFKKKNKDFEVFDFKQDYTALSIAKVNGEIWVGTEGQGVIIIKNGKIERKLTKSDGLLSDYVTMLHLTKSGTVLIGTNLGLNIIDADKNCLYSFSKQHGFTGIEVKNNSVLELDNGRVLIGTVDGLMGFEEQYLNQQKTEPKVFLTQMLVNLQEQVPTEKTVFPYGKNSFYFRFVSPNYTNPEAVKYQVRLKGIDNEWRPESSQDFVSFSSLSPGDYTLEIKAVNDQSVWTPEPLTYSFRIRPPIWQRWWFMFGSFVIILLAIYIYVKLRERQLKLEKEILETKVAERTHEVTEKNIELARINKDITDSINYARRIQAAIMRPADEVKKILSDSFIYYQPRDIVSGDFYWFSEKHESSVIVASDCTGHGVPGAFMSMIGISYLNEIVNEKKIMEPAEILNQLRANLISVLQQKGREGDTKEGMDMALLVIDYKNQRIRFAGAYNSLYLFREGLEDQDIPENASRTGNLMEIKGDRMPVGISTKDQNPFNAQELDFRKGDRFYMTTDGYIDQFGGPKGKKFLNKRFRELLIELSGDEINKIPEKLKIAFDDWRGENDQIDDVLVIGGKF